jgi:hypothetical protein
VEGYGDLKNKVMNIEEIIPVEQSEELNRESPKRRKKR